MAPPPSRGRRPGFRPLLELLEARLAPAGLLTYHNDNASSGLNTTEPLLTPAGVNAASFGKLFGTSVDGQLYAQPLVVPGVTITTGGSSGVHDVVYAATEHDSVYALDAATGAVLWQDNFLDPAAGVTTVPAADTDSGDLIPEIGITGTPVIDPTTNTLYVVAATKETGSGSTHYVQRLHALDLGSGAEKFGGPAVIADTVFDGTTYTAVSGPSVPGTGDGSVNGQVPFNALREFQRAALTLSDGTVYVAFASHGDTGPYHGWVLGYDAGTLALTAAFNDTPNGSNGGIWMSGGKVSVDAQGDLYLATGNGTFDSTQGANGFPSQADYGDSVLKLAPDPASSPAQPNANGWGLKVVDYFTPHNQADLDASDKDFGSGGVLLLPDTAGSADHPRLLVVGGKDGTLYLIDRDNLGKFDPSTDHVVQELPQVVSGVLSTPAWFNGKLFVVPAYGGGLAATFGLADGVLTAAPVAQSADTFDFPGSTPSVSADGTADGIVWDLDLGTNQLRAYDAGGYGTELYTSAQAANGRDQLDGVVKFTAPAVAGGRVYVGTVDALFGFGVLPAGAPAPPDQLSASALSAGQVLLTWHPHSDNESGFEVQDSTDGVTFTPAGSTGPGATTLTVTGLQAQTTYTFEVRAFNGIGASAWSPPATATTLSGGGTTTVPAAPTGLTAQAASGTSVQLAWTDTAGDATSFLIERSDGSDTAFRAVATVSAATMTYLDTGLAPGTDYFYRVRAVNAAGPSSPSNEADAVPPVPPLTPTNAHATQVQPTEIDLAWQNNATNADGYRILRKTGAGVFTPIASLPATATSYADTGLAPETDFDYHIQAYNVAGYSDFAGVSVSTPVPDPGTSGGGVGSGQAPPPAPAEKIGLTRTPLRRLRNGLLRQQVTLTNLGQAALPGPLSLMLSQLPRGVRLHAVRGIRVIHTADGTAYRLFTVPSLEPGQSVAALLTFTAPGRRRVRYRLEVE
jgi:hypothetical protein